MVVGESLNNAEGLTTCDVVNKASEVARARVEAMHKLEGTPGFDWLIAAAESRQLQ